MTITRERTDGRETTKRTLATLSHAVEEIAEAAAGDATVIAMFQHGAYFGPMRHRYERLAESGAAVVVAYVGGAPPNGSVHHVEIDADDELASEWSVAIITPTTGAYLLGHDLADFDASESDLESGRKFQATWGFDRLAASEQVERLVDRLERSLHPTLVEEIRASIALARRADVSLPERALDTTAGILVDRLEAIQRELVATRAELAKETDLAIRDRLTGLYNREGLERWLGGPSSDGLPMPPMGVILLDLDGFKAINDTLGHLVGDQLLRRIASTLLATLRPGDIAARWGGDEFIVLSPGVDDDELATIADRLIGAIVDVDVDGARVSASAGIKTCSRRPLPLHDADDALYAAKSAGGAQAAFAR